MTPEAGNTASVDDSSFPRSRTSRNAMAKNVRSRCAKRNGPADA